MSSEVVREELFPSWSPPVAPLDCRLGPVGVSPVCLPHTPGRAVRDRRSRRGIRDLGPRPAERLVGVGNL